MSKLYRGVSTASPRLCCLPKCLISSQLVVFQSEDAAAAAGNADILQPLEIENRLSANSLGSNDSQS